MFVARVINCRNEAHMTLRCVLGILVWLASLCINGSVIAQPSTLSGSPQYAYLVDPKGQMTLEQVASSPEHDFTSFDQAISLGYTPATVWLRLRIDPDMGLAQSKIDSEQLVLRLTNPLLNDVRLYDPLQDQGQPIVTGDSHPITEDEIDLSSLTFLLPRGDMPRDVYVSVQSSSSMVFSVVLETVETALKSNRTYDLLGGLYLGLLVVFLILALVLRIGRADRISNWFLLQQTLAVIWSLTLMGYLRQYLEPQFNLGSVDTLSNVVVVLYTYTVCQFGFIFLGQFELRRWARILVYLPPFYFLPLMLAVLFGAPREALHLNAYGVIAVSWLLLVMALFGVDRTKKQLSYLPHWLVVGFFALFSAAGPMATSVTLSVEPVFQNAFVGFFFTTALAGFLMSCLLVARSRALTREAIAASTALSLQQQRSQEQSMFLGMLAHEFKTPLSVLKIVIDSGQLDADAKTFSADAIRNIDALLNKCLQTEALMDGGVVGEAILLDLESLLRDVVAHYKSRGEILIDAIGPSEIRSDPAMVRVVVANLLDNAVKYGELSKPITIRLEPCGDQYVTIRVTNAIGRAGSPDPAKVFDKYYRSSGALSKSGSGLGLYLSKNIAKLLGGGLTFASREAQLWFELTLPKQVDP